MGDNRTPRGIQVFRLAGSYFPAGTRSGAPLLSATLKTGFASGRRGGFVHRPRRAVAGLHGDDLVYAAEWFCGDTSADVIPLRENDVDPALRCAKCDDAILGPAVYRFLDSDESLLYIGSAERFLVRRTVHAQTATWWSEVAHERIERFPTVFAARAAEIAAIRTEHPRYNIAHRVRAVA